MAIDCRYGQGFTTRRWTNRDGNVVELVCDDQTITIKATLSRDTDLDTFKAQLNNAIQDWRQYRAKAKKNTEAPGPGAEPDSGGGSEGD